MIITANIIIILTLGCFIIGIVAGVQLIRPKYYGNTRNRPPYTSQRYND